MKLSRLLLSLALVAVLTSVAYVGQVAEPAALKMAVAAEAFLGSLTADQKAKATFSFDDKERTNWYFVPRQDEARKTIRKGLPLEEMSSEQKAAALAILRAGTSASGYEKATTIMSLEALLREWEAPDGKMVRNPQWYFFSIFGTPSKIGKWGWRVEGHHLALNFTLDGDKVVSATPALFGANPATVKDGQRKGLRTLSEAEDLARALFKSLNDEQAKTALQSKPFEEIEQAKTAPNVGPARGLAAAQMNEEQKAMLWKLLESYARRMSPDVAQAELNQVKEAGLEQVRFAYTGSVEPGKPYTYRVQGPTFVVEFLNMQPDSAKNPANHIHSAWRRLQGDFGLTIK